MSTNEQAEQGNRHFPGVTCTDRLASQSATVTKVQDDEQCRICGSRAAIEIGPPVSICLCSKHGWGIYQQLARALT